MIDLSILVPSVHTRVGTFALSMQETLYGQWKRLSPEDQRRVEVLVWVDNKMRPLGRKRNEMLDSAQGRYVAFVDDDDRLDPSYLISLLRAIDRTPVDAILFNVSVSLNGAPPKPCFYSVGNGRDHNSPNAYYRLPNHLMCVKRELAVLARFPETSRGEDGDYARRLKSMIRSEFNIGRVLYHYDFDSELTETQR